MSKKMSAETNALNWFEIAVKDFFRAKRFYQSIFEIEMQEMELMGMEMMGMKMAMFPYDAAKDKVGGAIVQSQMHVPSASGAIIYLNANPDLQEVLDRVEKSGGKIAMPKTNIGKDIGYMAFINDTEGNHIGLHSNE